MLLTGGPRTANKIAALIFGDDEAWPRLIVKIARVPESRPGLLREAATLPGVEARCHGRLRGAPRVLFAMDDERGGAVGETALPGVPLHTLLTRRSFETFAIQATDWLVDLARCTCRADAVPNDERLITEAVADFTAGFGSVIDPALLARTGEIAERLGALPRVCEHRDFAPWNVFVTVERELAVYDWESSEPSGLPGLDLHYFLAYLAFALDRARRTPAMLRSYAALMDPASFTGSIYHACVRRYADRVGMDAADFRQVRLLTWIIHSRSEHRRLVADTVGSPSPDALRQSLFLGLWRAEAVRGLDPAAPVPPRH